MSVAKKIAIVVEVAVYAMLVRCVSQESWFWTTFSIGWILAWLMISSILTGQIQENLHGVVEILKDMAGVGVVERQRGKGDADS